MNKLIETYALFLRLDLNKVKKLQKYRYLYKKLMLFNETHLYHLLFQSTFLRLAAVDSYETHRISS